MDKCDAGRYLSVGGIPWREGTACEFIYIVTCEEIAAPLPSDGAMEPCYYILQVRQDLGVGTRPRHVKRHGDERPRPRNSLGNDCPRQLVVW